MIAWAVKNIFVWAFRVIALVVAVVSLSHIINEELGYRMELGPMFLIAVVTIVTVRIWMPWSISTAPSLSERTSDNHDS